MLSRANSMVWMEGSNKGGGDEETSSWPENNNKNSTELLNNKEEIEIGALSTYKTMLELADDQNEEWYSGSSSHQGAAAATTMHDISLAAADDNSNNNNNQLLLQSSVAAADSSASCNSPTSASVFNNLDTLSQVNYFQRSLINPVPNNNNNHPLEIESFDQMGCHEASGGGYLESAFMINRAPPPPPPPPLPQIGTLLNFSSPMFPTNTSSTSVGFGGTFDFGDGSMTAAAAAAVGNSFFNNNSRSNKILKPLDNFASIGSQPTLFQKRAALRKNNLAAASNSNLLKSPTIINMGEYDDHKKAAEMKIRKTSSSGDGDGDGDDDDDLDVDVLDDFSIDGSNLNYDSDDQFLDTNNTAAAVNNNNKVEFESGKNGNGGGSGDHKKGGGKKKGLPAKNLMAERRRRKKLNDRLYMLRSVVPKISKV